MRRILAYDYGCLAIQAQMMGSGKGQGLYLGRTEWVCNGTTGRDCIRLVI